MRNRKPNWKALFLKARKMLEDEERRHAAACGCRDVGDTVVEGPCPGVDERVKFLKNTAKDVSAER
jgi:hypothetical protein